ncbi:hypothetical protein [Mucilaginibacter boryungensis]|uniref:Uncharacterized protein n=1 Tax=Mucilaginibacter boryungensis TaxID=768480 RepID=A0ABR9XMH5_9SPHI|nr:hypothetical protein [Mucilaginibacter boryungensis]MBE9668215.1 hypothetical protein [Mucilaginibacter boryungensis]
MKFSKSLTMIPLMVGLNASGSIAHNTNLSFNENELNNNLINIDLSTFNYLIEVKEITTDSLYLKSRFKKYLAAWKRETFVISNIDKIINNRNFLNIINMGDNAVPFILNEIHNRPSNLVWAMNLIFKGRISNNNLTINEACKAWVKWGLSTRKISDRDLIDLA